MKRFILAFTLFGLIVQISFNEAQEKAIFPQNPLGQKSDRYFDRFLQYMEHKFHATRESVSFLYSYAAKYIKNAVITPSEHKKAQKYCKKFGITIAVLITIVLSIWGIKKVSNKVEKKLVIKPSNKPKNPDNHARNLEIFNIVASNEISTDGIDRLKGYLENGGDPNLKNTNDETLLMIAAKKGNYWMVNSLLKAHNIEVFFVNKDKKMASDLASSMQIKNLIRDKMMELEIPPMPEEIKKLIIESIIKEDPFYKDEKGMTFLMIAAEKGDLLRVKRLVEEGANINQKDTLGFTPLLYASFSNNWRPTMEYLIRNGADINSQDMLGKTILMRATDLGKKDIVEFLLKQPGINIEIKDNNGKKAEDFTNDIEIKKLFEKKS